MYITLKSIFLNVLQLKQKRAARLHVQLTDLDDEDQTNLVAPTIEAEEDFSAADASLEGPDVAPPIAVSSDPAPYTRPPLVRDPKRAKVIDTAPDEGIQALVHCSQQLVEVGDKFARYLRPESSAQERQRQHFAEMCANILRQLPEDLYMEALDRIWTVLQDVQRNAHTRSDTHTPPQPQAPAADSSRSNQQPQWQSDPSQWTSDHPPASVWSSMGCDYIRQTHPGYLQRQSQEQSVPLQSLCADIFRASMVASGIPVSSQHEEGSGDI